MLVRGGKLDPTFNITVRSLSMPVDEGYRKQRRCW